jgi:hypothetical protein
VNVKIGSSEGGRFRLRLRGGPGFHRQRAAFDQVHSGEAVPGELAIYQRGKRIMVTLVAWLPRKDSGKAKPEEQEVLTVRTDRKALLVGLNLKEERLWVYNGDHLVRWAAEHRNQLQRWSEDTKYEQRPVPRFANRREAAARKFRDRMNSATHEIAAQLAGYAERRRFSGVLYDDRDKSFCLNFPWFRLRELVKQKLDAIGIGITVVTTGEIEGDAGSSSQEKDQ